MDAIRNLDIDLLRSFTAIAETGSFTAAGQRVARSQSAISIRIRRLEETLGCRLFERTSRSLGLTAEGETLLGYAQRILALNDESVRRITAPPVTGTIRLGITEYFVPAELPRLLARFAGAHPGVHLEVTMGLSRELRGRLGAGGLDAVIVRLTAGERTRAIWTEPQAWVVRDGDEPAPGAPVPLVLLPEPCVLRAHALESMQRRRRACVIRFTGSSMSSVQAAVAAGLGVSIVPRSLVIPGMRVLAGRDYPDPGGLAIGVLAAGSARREVVEALRETLAQALAA